MEVARGADEVGRRVGGRYELLDELTGTDAYRRYAAVDVDGSRRVVSFFRGPPSDGFDDASRTFSRMRHAHLVPPVAFGVDEETGRGFVVEPEDAERTLARVLADGARLDPQVAIRIAGQLADGLAVAHERGICHGALDAHLVQLARGPDGHVAVRLTGFGLRFAAQSSTDARIDASPTSTVSPEQVTGNAATPASDVWALGGLLRRLVDGEMSTAGERTGGGELNVLIRSTRAADPDQRPAMADVADRLAALRVGPATLRDDAIAPLSPAELAPAADAAENAPSAPSVSATSREPRSPAAAPDPMIGRRVDGRWEVLGVIGVGGMGTVYEAREDDGSLVAVKIVGKGNDDPAGLRRFVRESRAALALHSENTVRIIAAGVDADLGMPFMVMERLRGRDLSETIALHGPLEPAVAARVFVEAARGLSVVHAAGMVHRDIKPSNIFLHEDGERVIVKLCDFGIVKTASVTEYQAALTHTGLLLGSPAYMSPEQAKDPRDVDARSDVWSLGMTLYQALSGSLAWTNWTNLSELVVMIYGRDPTPVQDIAPWIEPALATVVHRALTRDREQRWASAEELAEALSAHASPPPLTPAAVAAVGSERRATVAPRAVSTASQAAGTLSVVPPPRRRAVVGAGIAAVLAAMLAAGLLVFRSQRLREQAAATAAPSTCELAACSVSLHGAPATCREDGRCVALETPRCKVIADERALRDPSTLWVGAMFPTSDADPSLSEFGNASMQALELARRDFMSVSGGLPALASGGKGRPLGLVGCDDAADHEHSARHLVEQVGVPAVIGFRSSAEVIELSNSLFVPTRTLVVPALNQSALITSIIHPPDTPRMVWRTATSTKQRIPVLAAVVRDFLEPRARAKGSVRGGELRVALLRGQNPVGLALSEGLLDTMTFNGRSVAENGKLFRAFAYEDEAEARATLPGALADFAPSLIILESTNKVVVTDVLRVFEDRAVPSSRPLYLIAGAIEGDAFIEWLDKRADVAARAFGLTVPSQTAVNLKFTSSYNANFKETLAPSLSPGAPYDSFYLVAYAAYVSGVERPTGADLAVGIERLLPPGKPVDVGPTSILRALEMLQRKESIDLVGTYSRMDFDKSNGESENDCAIQCVRRESAAGGRLEVVESGLVYDAKEHAIRGSFACGAPK